MTVDAEKTTDEFDLELKELARMQFRDKGYVACLLFYKHITNKALLDEVDKEIIGLCKHRIDEGK